MNSRTLDDIPGPKGVPLVGNMFDIKQATLIQDLMRLAREWGPIFTLTSPDGPRYVVHGLEMVDDLCDDARFDKLVGLSQREFRKTHKSAGLFTADTDDPLWKSAHDILLPSFSTWAMKGYLDPMIDIAEQLCLKWERMNPDEPIDVAADMTRLTLDTIALCGFSYRFNSFYRDSEHPFVAAMMGALHETQARQRLLPVAIKLRRRAQRQLLADSKYMDDTVGTILAERKASGEPGTDLLGHMLVGTDKQGNSLPDHNIVAQCETFLVAGHETTSGLLSFAVCLPSQAPGGRRPGPGRGRPGARDRPVGAAHRRADPAARLHPADPRRDAAPLADGARVHPPGSTSDHGRWLGPVRARPGGHCAHTDAAPAEGGLGRRRRGLQPGPLRPPAPRRPAAQRVPAVRIGAAGVHRAPVRPAGGDAGARHAPAAVRVRRPCELPAQDQGVPDHQARRADDHRPPPLRADLGRDAAAGRRRRDKPRTPALAVVPTDRHGTPLLVLFGSNFGAAEDSPRGSPARRRTGATPPAPPGSTRRVGELPTEGAVVVVTSSYNGQPPDNAAKFCTWVDDPATSLAGVRYTVFGCGNRDWSATYQAVPTRVDAALEARGATRVYPRGEGDARGDFDAQFEAWYAGLWDALGSALGLDAGATATAGGGPRLSATFEQRRTASPILQSYRGQAATLRVNRELTARAGTPGGRSVRHLEIALPPGTSYAAGDHLGVLPRNDVSLVNRAIARFGLDAGQYVTLTASGGAPTHLPLGEPYPLLGILAGCVELQDVASRAGLAAMAAHLPEGPRPRRARRPGRDGRRVAGPVPGEDRRSPAHAARSARGPPRVRPAVRGVPGPPAAAAPAVLLDLLVAGGELRRRVDRRRARGPGALRGRLDVPRRVLRAPAGRPRGRHRVRLRPAAEHRLPAAGEPARPDDHGGCRDRDGSVPRVPPGAGVAAGAGRPDRHVAAVPRLPGPGRRPALRRRAEGLRGGRGRDGDHGLLADQGLPAPLRPARPRGVGGPGVGGDAAGRGGVRVR